MATGVFGIVLKWCVFGKRICSYLAKGKFAAIEITIFSCNSFDYFIPFSSPDKKDDYDKDGKIRKSSMVVVRMIEKKKEENKLLGTLRLNSMIPICNKDVIKKYDILQEKDIFYKNLPQRPCWGIVVYGHNSNCF